MRAEKQYLVDDLSDKIKKAKGVFITNYLGLTSESLGGLRKECRKQSCQYLVVKNRILKIALKNAGIEVDQNVEQVLRQSTAVALSSADAVAAAKLLIKQADQNGITKVKGGIVEGRWFDEKHVVEFSKLPSREVLLAKFIGMLKSPLTGFVSVLNAPLRNFTYALNGVGDKKQS